MEPKHYFAIFVVITWIPLGVVLAANNRRFVDMLMALLVVGTVRVDLLAIEFVSRAWYRGTSVGFELSWLDLLWPIILIDELRRRKRGTPLPMSFLAMWVVFAYDVLSVATSTPQLFGMFELWKVFRGILLFLAVALYVKSEWRLKLVAWSFSAAMLIETVFALYSRVFHGRERSLGTFPHPNILSMYGLILVPFLLAIALSDASVRLRAVSLLAAGAGAICVLLTVSRSGLATLVVLLAGIGFTCGTLRITPKKLAIGFLAVLVASLVIYKTAGSYAARFAREGGFTREFEANETQGRGLYLTLANRVVADHPWGVGLNNWSYWVTNQYARPLGLIYGPYTGIDYAPPLVRVENVDSQHAAPAHGLYPITLGELGWMGVFLLAILWSRWFQMTGSFLFKRSRQFVSRIGVGLFFSVAGAMSQSLTEWELRQTSLLFTFMILLGVAAAIYPIRPSVLALEGRMRT